MKALEALKKYGDLVVLTNPKYYVQLLFCDTDEYQIIKQSLTELETMKAKVKRYFELNDKWSASNKNTDYVRMSGLTVEETNTHKIIENELKEWSERE